MGRTGRAIAGVALIGAGAAIATGWWWPSTASATATLREEVRTVKIDNDSGDVSIRVGEGATTTVHQRIHYNWNQPDEDDVFSLEGGVLVLTDCGWQCDVDYEVVVPRGTAVQGQVNSGDIELSGVDEVDVDANSGDVNLRGITGTVKAEANSGDIEGTGLSGPVDVVANSGDIELALDEAGSVTATANSGNIDLTVPDGRYRVDGESNSGEREIDITTDPDASHVLSLTAQSGDVSVRAGGR